MRRPPSFKLSLRVSLGVVALAALSFAVSERAAADRWLDLSAAGAAEEPLSDGPLELPRRGVHRHALATFGPGASAPTAFEGMDLVATAPSPMSVLDPALTGRWVARNAAEAVILIENEGAGTYIDELLIEADSALTRWPSRGKRPITFWLQSAPWLESWVPGHAQLVRDAFEEWQNANLPLRFAETADSARADIVVAWTTRFAEPISGKTRWTHDRGGWIRSASVTIALHRSTGDVLDNAAIRAIGLHEIGHALGLDHTRDHGNVMAPRVRVRGLSAADRATAQLLYRLPPGSMRQVTR